MNLVKKIIKNGISQWAKLFLNNLKYRRATKVSRILITLTILLYFGGIISFVFGIFFSEEWINESIPIKFIYTGIVIPVFIIAVSFLIQIIAIILDFYDRVTIYTEQSKFLSALEKCSIKTNIHRLFLSHLVDQWQDDVDHLNKGLISIHHNYWEACANFFEYATQLIECTSSVPLVWWDKDSPECDQNLLKYKELQKKIFISRGIKVNRTFILEKKPQNELFFKVIQNQLNEKFYLYYIKLYDIEIDIDLKEKLLTDFLLMDNKLLMVGKFQEGNRSVYYYDFHILSDFLEDPNIHLPDIGKIFINPEKVHLLNLRELQKNMYLQQHRKPIYEYDDFLTGSYKAIIDSILLNKKIGRY